MAKRILVAVIFVPLLFAVILAAPAPVWTAVVVFISGMAAYELLRAAGQGKVTPAMEWVSVLSACAVPLGTWLGAGQQTVSLCALAVMAVCFWGAIRAYDGKAAPTGLYQVLLCLFGGVVIPLMLSALVELMAMDQGRYLVLLAVVLAFITDGGAYFAGVFLGKHRGITKVSPNKSVEGYIGGFVVGTVFAVAYGAVVGAAAAVAVNYLSLALCGLLGALATELGDLAFSFVKREYGIKDFGNLLPGHGGMLDRFDSMIFCAPAVLFLVTLLPAFPGVA